MPPVKASALLPMMAKLVIVVPKTDISRTNEPIPREATK
jgi:hypothetical protein